MSKKMMKIVPLKDHVIVQNEVFYELKEGSEIEIETYYKDTLIKEKVILVSYTRDVELEEGFEVLETKSNDCKIKFNLFDTKE